MFLTHAAYFVAQDTMSTVAYQGEPGSYSEEAVWRRFAGEGVVPLACATVAEAVQAVVDGRASLVLLPVENKLTGPIEEMVAEAARAGLVEQRSFWLAIEHCLVGHPDTRLEEVRCVFSHPEALAQCSSFLKQRGVEAVPAGDTAGAVRQLKQRGIASEAAIASARAAAKHNMRVLARGIQDPGDNRTRFALLMRPRRAP